MTEPTMQDALAAIDISPLEALTRLRGDIDTLEQRLQQMEARRSDVAAAVYTRVRADYEQRRAALQAEAMPLQAAAREQYSKLHSLLAKSEAEHEAARLDREEIEFRHSLGEFDDADFRQRLADVETRLAARAGALEQAAELRQRFVTAFGSEDALSPTPAEVSTQRLPTLSADAVTPPPSSTASAPPAPVEAATQPLPVLDPVATVAMPLPPAPPARPDVGATQPMKVLKGGTAAARPDQTVIIRSARLVPQNSEAGKLTHTVGLTPVTIGSAEQCDVRVPGAAPRHAQIKVGMSGFGLADLGGGVRVNGIRVEQHLLHHDDVIEIAAARFVFREG